MTIKEEIEAAKKKSQPIESFINIAFSEFGGEPEINSLYFAYLFLDFPKLDIVEELKQYYAWTLDRTDKKKLNHHSRFRQWLKKSLIIKQIK